MTAGGEEPAIGKVLAVADDVVEEGGVGMSPCVAEEDVVLPHAVGEIKESGVAGFGRSGNDNGGEAFGEVREAGGEGKVVVNSVEIENVVGGALGLDALGGMGGVCLGGVMIVAG